VRVTEHISSVRIPFEIPLPTGARARRSVYAHVVHGKRACFIDSGVSGSADVILALLREACGDACEPTTLLLTHTHPDHIGSARTLRERTGVEIGCPSGEAVWLEDVQKQMIDRPVPGFASLVEGPAKVDFPVEDGLELDLGGVRIKAFTTPGHSPASTCYRVLEDDAVVSGDAVPLLTEPPIYDDAMASLKSMRKFRLSSPAHLLPSWHDPLHGDAVLAHIFDGERAIVRFHAAVVKTLDANPQLDDEIACPRVLSELGFDPGSANPLILRTFRAHRRALPEWPGV